MINVNNCGLILFKNYLTRTEQELLVADINQLLDESEPFVNKMWNGYPYKVVNANAGDYGWYSDEKGYHYTKFHPITKKPWPKIPERILSIVKDLTDKTGYTKFKPESCYINFYSKDSSLGLHQDNSEKNLEPPIVSISLGDTAHFYLGGKNRKDKTEKILLESGDCYVQGGESRLFYHSVKRIVTNSSNLVPGGGRINLTIRQVY